LRSTPSGAKFLKGFSMNRRSFSAWFLLSTLFFVATAAWAATVTYTPPAQTGTIYTVINYRRSLGVAVSTNVTVKWGTFSRSGKFSAPSTSCGLATNSGIVLVLRHTAADSVPLTLTTDGSIVRGPYQGSAPSQLGAPCYVRVDW
jgi:hypothetical protein